MGLVHVLLTAGGWSLLVRSCYSSRKRSKRRRHRRVTMMVVEGGLADLEGLEEVGAQEGARYVSFSGEVTVDGNDVTTVLSSSWL